MKALTIWLIVFLAYLFNGQVVVQAQSSDIRVVGQGCSTIIQNPKKKLPTHTLTSDAAFRWPIRYVVVYNEISDLGVREIEILISAKHINQNDLLSVFCGIAEKYVSPADLFINAHTSLDTIETPEEREMEKDGNDSRFSPFYGKSKAANFGRLSNGRESFSYTTSLSPFRELEVVLQAKRR